MHGDGFETSHLMALQFMTYPALQIYVEGLTLFAMPCHLTRHEKCVMRGRYDVHVDEVGFTSSPAEWRCSL